MSNRSSSAEVLEARRQAREKRDAGQSTARPVATVSPRAAVAPPRAAGDGKASGLYRNVIQQFNKAADLTDLDPDIRKILATTQNEIVVHFPVRMDDGAIEIFTGYRVHHNDALGPFKGGLRYHPQVDLDEVRALASWMTWKSALVEIGASPMHSVTTSARNMTSPLPM